MDITLRDDSVLAHDEILEYAQNNPEFLNYSDGIFKVKISPKSPIEKVFLASGEDFITNKHSLIFY